MTFAAIDVEKERDKGGDGHGSKVIVVSFDGAALDRDRQAEELTRWLPVVAEADGPQAATLASTTR